MWWYFLFRTINEQPTKAVTATAHKMHTWVLLDSVLIDESHTVVTGLWSPAGDGWDSCSTSSSVRAMRDGQIGRWGVRFLRHSHTQSCNWDYIITCKHAHTHTDTHVWSTKIRAHLSSFSTCAITTTLAKHCCHYCSCLKSVNPTKTTVTVTL